MLRRGLYLVCWVVVTTHAVSSGMACLSNPCLHGICIDDVNSTYSCYCVDGFTGVLCQTNWDECWSDPCQNGGSCVDGIASYNCTCPDGFVGDNCEINYNECDSNPCQNNGTCIDMTNSYVCSCLPGFSGDHCEMDIAVCNATDEIRCYNGGQCIEGPGFRFYCRCTTGWGGPKCEEEIDECASNPCRNGGVCIDIHADYMCACPFGFTGKSCEVAVEFCTDNSCSNEALCVVEDGTEVCYCVPDYHGEHCELQYDECLLGPGCMNGGTCIDGIDNYTCSCPPNLTGKLCECLIINNDTIDCTYIRPTELPTTTKLDLVTLIEESTSTELVSVLTPSDYTILVIENVTEGYKPEVVTDSSTFHEAVTDTYTDVAETTVTVKENLVTLTEFTELTTDKAKTVKIEETTTVDLTSTTQEQTSSETTTLKSEMQTFETQTPQSMVTGVTCKTCMKPLGKTTVADIQTSTMTNAITPLDTNIPTTTKELPTTVTADRESKEIDTTLGIDKETTTTDVKVSDNSTMTYTKADETTTVKNYPVIHVEDDMSTKFDETTERLFTKSPTEYATSEATTPYNLSNVTNSVTEDVFESPTTSDLDLTRSTALPNDCSSSVCNNKGTCFQSPRGIRCHCNFNYGGRFCDEKISISSAAFTGNSYIAHKMSNSSSLHIEFEARTLLDNGQIMFVDISKGVYMQLFIKAGLLKFMFSCGYQTMLLSELKTFVNTGYAMKIASRLELDLKSQHCNATLQINDTAAMSGGQVANVSYFHQNITLYLGNSRNVVDNDNKPFIGCIKNLKINEEDRAIFDEALEAAEVSECSSLSCLSDPCFNGGFCKQLGDAYSCSCTNGWMGDQCERSICEHNPCHSGGSCVKHPATGFLCLCPFGKHGIFCEYNVEITRSQFMPLPGGLSSYLIYPLSPSAVNSERFDLRLRFQTSDLNQIALLAYVGQRGKHDSHSHHIAVTFVRGYVMLTWNLGHGPRRIFTPRPITERRGGHIVRVGRRGRNAWLSVDAKYNVSGNSPGTGLRMVTLPYLYLGGHPSQGFTDLPHDLPLHAGWFGCVWDINGAAILAGKPSGGRGVGQCGVSQCSAKSCSAPNGVCVQTPASYGCICSEGWFGATCALSVPVFSTTQCRGRLVMTVGQPECDCPYGTTGTHCDQELQASPEVSLSGVRSFVRVRAGEGGAGEGGAGGAGGGSARLSLGVAMRARAARGVVVAARAQHYRAALTLQGGLLDFRYTEYTTGVTSLVRSGSVLSLSSWHNVKCGRYGNKLFLWLDGAITVESMLVHSPTVPATNISISIGGAEDLSSLPFDVMSGPPEPFNGCLKNFQLNDVPIPLDREHIEAGNNIGACAESQCGAGAGESRCRRAAPCRVTHCHAPHGRCVAHECRCLTGYTGLDCRQQINITIPHFTGDSLLTLGQKEEAEAMVGAQKMSYCPEYLALNFTTSTLEGVLLILGTNDTFLGISLEEGYLQLKSAVKQSIHMYELQDPAPEVELQPLPSFGFLADAEWHLLTVRVDGGNYSLSVDGDAPFVERRDLCSPESGLDVNIGGVPDKLNTHKKYFSKNFEGCIHVFTQELENYPINYNSIYSENVKSCIVFP